MVLFTKTNGDLGLIKNKGEVGSRMKCTACGFDMDGSVNICPNCGKEYSECVYCGSYIEKDMQVYKGCESISISKNMKSESKLKLVAVLSVVIFVFAIFAIAFIFKDMSGEYPNLLLYRKEDGIYMTNFGKGKTTKLDAQISNHGTRISQDGKRFFYLDDTDNSLNYVELSFGWKTGVVDKSVRNFMINQSGNIVYYIKGNTSKGYLYKSDLKSSKLVAEGVQDFRISPDGKKLICLTDTQVYLYKNDKLEFSSKLSRKAATPILADFNLNHVLYMKDEKVYLYKHGEVKEIYDGAKDLVSCLEDGRAYFWSKENKLCYYNLEKVKEVSMNEGQVLYADVIEPIVVLTSSGKTYVVVDGIVNTNEEIYGTPVKALSYGRSVVVLITGGNLFLYDTETHKWEKVEDGVSNFGITVKGELVYIRTAYQKHGELYVNGEIISRSAYKDKVYADFQGNIIYQTIENEGAMYLRDESGSTKQIAPYYRSFFYYSPTIVFHTRSIPNTTTMALFFFDGKDIRVFEEDVTSIIPLRGETYGYYDFGYSANYGLNIYNLFEEE